jgi:hypothetical protein
VLQRRDAAHVTVPPSLLQQHVGTLSLGEPPPPLLPPPSPPTPHCPWPACSTRWWPRCGAAPAAWPPPSWSTPPCWAPASRQRCLGAAGEAELAAPPPLVSLQAVQREAAEQPLCR